MFDGLLDAARIDAGILEPELRTTPLERLFEPLRSESSAIAASRGIRVRVRPTPLHVETDPLLLRSVLQNLLGNALRYTRKGGVLVGARRRGDHVRLEVWDTGPGIADLILTDLWLGEGETGLELLRRVEARLGRSVAAAVLTADTDPGTAQRVQAAGRLLLHKPVAAVRLRAAVGHLINERG